MKIYKHRKLGWIAKPCPSGYIIAQTLDLIKEELLVGSKDREEIKDQPQRTHDGMYIGDCERGKHFYVNSDFNVDEGFVGLDEGFCFKTEQQGQSFVSQLKVYKAIKKRQFINDDGWLPDWNNLYQKKRYMTFDHGNKDLCIGFTTVDQDMLQIYFSSKEIGYQCIRELELKIY